MKRLQPLSLTAISADECRLLCRPKFSEIGKEEQADLLNIMRQIAVGECDNDDQLEAEFVFTFNENGAVLKDKYFFALTTDDYGELWIERAVDCLAVANEKGVEVSDLPGAKSVPRTIFVDAAGSQPTRRYRVVFVHSSQSHENDEREYEFTVEGGKGSVRTISWMHGSYVASWELKKWTFVPSPTSDLEPLLMAIVRLDEAINLELMPYAMS